MNKLEQLKKEMVNARKAYEDFKINFSRELTEEESKDTDIFIGVKSTTRMFELKEKDFNEMKRLEKNMNNTYKSFIEEYRKNDNKIK